MNGLLAFIAAYVAIQLAIGVWIARRVRTEDDYLVAGRRLGPVLVSASVFATWFGAETCVGAAGEVYERGLGRDSAEPLAYGVCLLVMGLVYAAPFWRSRITTLADLLRQRFSPGVERLAALILVPTSVLWAAAQVRAFGHVLSSASELQLETSLAIAAGIAIVYTTLGGLLADVVTDLVQGVALIVGLAVLLVAVGAELGGPTEFAAAIDPARLSFSGPDAAGWLATAEAWAVPLVGSVVAQEIVQRALAARSAQTARVGTLLGGALYLAVGAIPVLLGLVAFELVPGLDEPEQVLAVLARTYLPTFGYAIFAGALISAILSTIDSTLLVASSLFARNLVLSGGEPASERKRLVLARGGVVLFGLVAWALAHGAERILDLVHEASAFGSAGILVVVSFALFTRWGGPRAAALSLLAGLAAWIGAAYGPFEHSAPYLFSLVAALLGYVLGAALLDRQSVRR